MRMCAGKGHGKSSIWLVMRIHGSCATPALRKRFQTEAEIEVFWKLSDGQRRGLYGTPLDIAQEPLVQE